MNDAFAVWDRLRDDPPPPSGAPPGLDPWPTCPFSLLGSDGSAYWFINESGALVSLAPSSLAQWANILALTGTRQDWLVEHFRALDREGNPTNQFSARAAASAIMARAAALPPFDAALPRRRYGLWPVPGGHALHLGDRILWRGDDERAGFVRHGAIWLRLAPRPAPAPPADSALGARLERMLGAWRWRDQCGPAVMLGLIVSGWLAGALAWRPHGFVVGEAGSGKTTLLRDFIGALCPLTRYLNDYTEPGLRQLLSETAACIVLDEAEADAATEQRLRRSIEMLRRASSGVGVQSVKGTADHRAREFTLTGSAIMGAIFLPPLEVQDASRFTVLELAALDAADHGGPRLEEALAFAADHGPALWGRAVANVGRAVQLIGVLRARLIGRGYSARLADQLATIAGCRWIIVRDEADDPRDVNGDDGADEALAIVEGIAMAAEEDRATETSGAQALRRLLTAPADMTGDKQTLGQVLNRLRCAMDLLARLSATDASFADEIRHRTEEAAKLDALLQGHGLRWMRAPAAVAGTSPAPPLGLMVTVAAHPRLERVFADTAWGGRRWGAALAQLPGAVGGKALPAQRIGSVKTRAVWLPETLFEPPVRDD